MCTGLEAALIAGTVLSAAGSAASTVSAQKQQKAQVKANNQVVQQFMDKNKKLSEESRALFDKRMEGEQAAPEEAAKPKAEERTAAAGELIDATRVVAPLRGSAPSVVREAAEQETERVDEQGRKRAQSLADARSFGDLLFGKGLNTRESANDIGMIGGFAQSNADMVPMQAELAQIGAMGKGKTLGTIGSGLSTVGSLLSSGAGSGMFGAGGSSLAPKTSPMPKPRPRY